ncbi:MAG: hypothetical protein ACKV22_03140 [Bryobacteraceae bacterium]
MTVLELSDEKAAKLKARAAAQGLTLEAWLDKLADEAAGAPARVQPPASPRRHISEVILERMSKVPPEVMAAMSKDGASQHDHYIYGLPKREE